MTQTQFEFKTQPYEHQRKALRNAWKREAYAFFMEMGTGKTKVAIDEMSLYFEWGLIRAAVVLAPKGVYLNWLRELGVHMPDRVRDAGMIVEWRAGGGGAEHQSRLRSLLTVGEGIRVLVMNIEALSSGTKAAVYLRKFLAAHRCYMAVDESTFIKNPSANRTKSIVELGKLAAYRRIMTGSPVTRSPLDLYSQFEFLAPGLLGSRSYYAFRARFAVVQQKDFGGRKVQVVVGYKNTEELTAHVQRHSYRVTKDECLDLPPKIYTMREVELTDEQRRMYTEMKEFAVAELEQEGFVSANAVIVQLLRLHQLVCGHVTDDDGHVRPVKSNRLDALMEVIAETDGKVVIWSRYRYDIEQIAQALSREYGPRSVAQYHGGNTNTRQEDATRFIEDPECRFMISNAQSGGYGNTWTVATTMVYYSNDYDLEKRIQSEDRAHRSGQTRSVTYVDLVAPGTVDEKILQALRKKINISVAIMGDGFREWIV